MKKALDFFRDENFACLLCYNFNYGENGRQRLPRADAAV
jgi:hypothetical protein